MFNNLFKKKSVDTYDYYAFISHKDIDKPFAKRLLKKIENYTVPKRIRRITLHKTKQVRNICLDNYSFTGGELRKEIDRKIQDSEKLILICSKNSANPILNITNDINYVDHIDWTKDPSRTGWVGYEIVRFLEYHDKKDIIPVVIDGNPETGDCFHPYFKLKCIDTEEPLIWHDFRGEKIKRRSLLRLIACILSLKNQEELIKRDVKRRIAYILLIIAIIIAAVAAIGINHYNYYFPHTEIFEDYTIVNGKPKGISMNAAPKVMGDHYKITTIKCDNMIILEHVNSHGVVTEDSSENHLDAPMIAKYSLLESGNINTVEYLNRNGSVTMAFDYTNDMKIVRFQKDEYTSDQVYPTTEENEYGVPNRLKIDSYYQEYYEEGYLKKRMYKSGVNYVVDESGIAGEQYSYDEYGRIKSIQYLNYEGDPSVNQNGIAEISFNYDEYGRQTEKKYLNLNGSLIYGPEDYALSVFEYSDDGRIIQADYFGSSKEHVINAKGYSVVEYEYNDDADRIAETYFDAEGNPIFSKDGCHKKQYEYNENGDIVKESYFDDVDKLTINKDGYACVKKECDASGNVTKISYYNENGIPLSMDNHSASIEYEVDERGCITEEVNFDEVGNRVLTAEGYSIKKIKLDEIERPIEIAYFDINDKAVNLKVGYHKLRFSYDNISNLTEIAAYDNKDCLVTFSGYWAIQKRKYNGGGYVTSVSYENQFEKPVMIRGGYASLVNSYDDAGHLCSTSYYDEKGNLYDGIEFLEKLGVPNAERTYSRIEFEYDDYGNVWKEIHLDSNQTSEDISAIAIYENTYDPQGRRLTHTCRKLVGSKESEILPQLTYKYDEYGNITETAMFDATTGIPYANPTSGIQKKVHSYDERRHLIFEAHYNADGDLIGSAKKYEYNKIGFLCAELFVDQDENPYTTEEGYSRIEYEYDKNNNQTNIKYKDTDNELVDCIYGFAETVNTYDINRNKIAVEYLDKTGKPTENLNYGFSKLVEELNNRRNTTAVCVYDQEGRLLFRYEAKYLEEGYKTYEAIYGPDGTLLTDSSVYNIAKCVYGYDDHLYRSECWFYNENDELIDSKIIPAGYKSIYEAGLERKRSYYNNYKQLKKCEEGYASIVFTYDEYGREIKREFFDENEDPCNTIFGFQSYEIVYSDGNEIKECTFYDKLGRQKKNISGVVRKLNLLLNGQVNSRTDTVYNSLYITRVAYCDNSGKYDCMLVPEVNLLAHVRTGSNKLIQKAKKEIIEEPGNGQVDISKYEDGLVWDSLISNYSEAINEGDVNDFFKIYMMDSTLGAVNLLNSTFKKSISCEELYEFYKEFYKKSLSEYKDYLTEKYGRDFTLAGTITNVDAFNEQIIKATNDTFAQYGIKDFVIDDYVVLTVRFDCHGSKESGVENRSFLYSQMPLFKVNGIWKLGQSNQLPCPSNDEIIKKFNLVSGRN